MQQHFLQQEFKFSNETLCSVKQHRIPSGHSLTRSLKTEFYIRDFKLLLLQDYVLLNQCAELIFALKNKSHMYLFKDLCPQSVSL